MCYLSEVCTNHFRDKTSEGHTIRNHRLSCPPRVATGTAGNRLSWAHRPSELADRVSNQTRDIKYIYSAHLSECVSITQRRDRNYATYRSPSWTPRIAEFNGRLFLYLTKVCRTSGLRDCLLFHTGTSWISPDNCQDSGS